MKYLRRLIWHIASRLLIVTVVLGLMVVSFYYAMNMSNMYVVLKDGMARRAQVVMMQEDVSELSKYFQQSFIERDTAVVNTVNGYSPYQDYTVRGIDHRLEMGFAWVWPWDSSVRVDITERIPRIDGRVKGAKAEQYIAQYGDDAIYPPEWTSARYRATLVKENGQWRIRTLTLLEELAE
ncbi:MAG: hypothetical protein IJ438_14610 [Clostridia bacterium]|nr:hypothetical protein [Clostridia bacterium]